MKKARRTSFFGAELEELSPSPSPSPSERAGAELLEDVDTKPLMIAEDLGVGEELATPEELRAFNAQIQARLRSPITLPVDLPEENIPWHVSSEKMCENARAETTIQIKAHFKVSANFTAVVKGIEELDRLARDESPDHDNDEDDHDNDVQFLCEVIKKKVGFSKKLTQDGFNLFRCA